MQDVSRQRQRLARAQGRQARPSLRVPARAVPDLSRGKDGEDAVSDLLSTIRARIDADLAAATKVVNGRQAALTQAQGIQSGLEHVKEAMDRFDAGVYPTDEDAAESAAVEGLHWPQPPAPAAELRSLPMTDEELDAATRYVQSNWSDTPFDPPATRKEILWQLQRHPPGYTSLELQARLGLEEAVVDGHLRALRQEGAVERATFVEHTCGWRARQGES